MRRVAILVALIAIAAVPLHGQSPTASPPSAVADEADEDATINPAEPDSTLVGLPTALRLPRHGSAFRVTHRFARPLEGDFGDLAADLFGLDSGAQIGLEYRFGIIRNGQVGVHRTSDRTLEFFGQYGVVRQTRRQPVDVSLLATVEGGNNFQEQYSPSLMILLSRRFRDRVALYIQPAWVHLAPLSGEAAGVASNTFFVGLGGRVRVWKTVSVAAEVSPRAGDDPGGVNHAAVAVEKRLGGHVFQLNVSDSMATTMGQMARGGPAARDWFLGFNISRKFF